MSKGSVEVHKSLDDAAKILAKEVAVIEAANEIKIKVDGSQAKTEAKETADTVINEVKRAQKDSTINITADGSSAKMNAKETARTITDEVKQAEKNSNIEITADGSSAINQSKRTAKEIQSEINKIKEAIKELNYNKLDLLGSSKTNRKKNIANSYADYELNSGNKFNFLKDAYAIELANEKLSKHHSYEYNELKENDNVAKSYLTSLKKQTLEYEKQGNELQNSLALLQKELTLINSINSSPKPKVISTPANEDQNSDQRIQAENSALLTQKKYIDELSLKEKELWDLRFNNSIKELTYRDPIFDKMKEYYHEQEVQLKKLQTIKSKYGNYVNDVTDINQARISFNSLLSDYKSAGPIIERNLSNGMQQFSATVKDAEGNSKKLVATIADGKMYSSITKSTEATNAFSKFTAMLGDRWKAVAAYVFSFSSFYEILNILKQGFTIVNELDDALTEMRKVSEEPLSVLKAYQVESFTTADAIGTTAKALQDSTADWMRLGESLDDAKESAKDSTILMNVSEFDNIDDATKSLVAMSQAYEEFEKIEIIDKLNNIGNNYSIATNDLASSLQRSAATLKLAGNSLDEAIALTTAGNSILQDPDSVGAGLKTISLRILGTEEAKEELASLGEDVDDFIVQTSSKLDEQVRHFTAVASNSFEGISLLDDNGNYRSTYQILADIATIYEEIIETDKKYGTNRGQGLIELLAGKNRANILASILQAPDLLKSVYESSLSSEGSAEEELNKYLDSISGKVDKLKNQIQELASVSINSDFLKDAVVALTDLLSLVTQLIDKIGILPTLGVGGGALLGLSSFIKNFGRTHCESLKIA